MSIPVYVFDPTEKDALSKVRGIGRYLQLLKENFSGRFIFTADFIHISFNSVFINPFFNFLQTPLIMKRVSQKQIAVIHDLIPLKYPQHFPVGLRGKINIFLNKQALKNYDLIITDSQASKKDIVQILHVPETKIKIVYPCLSQIFINSTKPTTYNLPPTSYLLYVGDATWNKNLVNLAKAIKLGDIPCVFVGKVFESGCRDGRVPDSAQVLPSTGGRETKTGPRLFSHPWQKTLKEFFLLVKDDKKFIFKGFVSDKELIKLYKQALANMLVSSDEGFGFSYLEASSQGCPSVLSNIPTLKEISNSNCVLVDPNNPKDIASKIKLLQKDGKLRSRLSFEALEQSKYFYPKKFQKEFWRCLS